MMDYERFVLATILSGLVMFLLAAVWNLFIVRNFVEANIPIIRSAPIIPLIVLGYLVLALFMSCLYPRLIESNGNTIIQGFIFGIFMGLLWMLPFNIVLHGNYEFPFISLFIDTGWAIVEQGIGGIVIALTYSFKK